MKVVVVKSPSKAKTINKYLGPGYEVLASFGHIRDLPAKDGSVDPDNDFKMLWEVDPQSQNASTTSPMPSRVPTLSSLRPTLIAKAKPFRGTCSRRSTKRRR